MGAVKGLRVVPSCPSSLNVSWTPLPPEDLGGPGHTSYYTISYSSDRGGHGGLTVPYLQDNWVGAGGGASGSGVGLDGAEVRHSSIIPGVGVTSSLVWVWHQAWCGCGITSGVSVASSLVWVWYHVWCECASRLV